MRSCPSVSFKPTDIRPWFLRVYGSWPQSLGGIESQDHTGQDRLITISKEGNAIGLTSSAVCFSRLETATQFCICHKVTSRIRQLSRAAPHGTVLVAFNKLRTAPAGCGMLSLRTQRSIVSWFLRRHAASFSSHRATPSVSGSRALNVFLARLRRLTFSTLHVYRLLTSSAVTTHAIGVRMLFWLFR